MIRRRCVNFDDTKAHDRKFGRRGEYVGDSPKQTKLRKKLTNRRERNEGKREAG